MLLKENSKKKTALSDGFQQVYPRALWLKKRRCEFLLVASPTLSPALPCKALTACNHFNTGGLKCQVQNSFKQKTAKK